MAVNRGNYLECRGLVCFALSRLSDGRASQNLARVYQIIITTKPAKAILSYSKGEVECRGRDLNPHEVALIGF